MKQVHRHVPLPDSRGKVSGSYTFTSADPLDDYIIRCKGSIKGFAEVKVAEYRKAKVRLDISHKKHNDKIDLTFKALNFMNKKVPGVGFSIGISRLLDLIIREKLIEAPSKSSAQVLMTVLSEEQRQACSEMADSLRELGVSVELFFRSPKLGKQIDYAEKKGIRHVCFLSEEGKLEVKDLDTKDQTEIADIESFALSLRSGE